MDLLMRRSKEEDALVMSVLLLMVFVGRILVGAGLRKGRFLFF